MLIPNAQASKANSKPSTNEITITLFGQPCTLSGPFAKQILQEIHKISPEQNPDVFESINKTKILIEKLNNIASLPKDFETYKEKLLQFYTSRIVFLEALEQSKKDKKFEPFYRKISDYLSMRNPEELRRNIETQWKTWVILPKTDFDLVLETYKQWSTPHPEELFHRVIKNIKTSYHCSFDAREEDSEIEISETKTKGTAEVENPAASPSPKLFPSPVPR